MATTVAQVPRRTARRILYNDAGTMRGNIESITTSGGRPLETRGVKIGQACLHDGVTLGGG